MSTTKKSSTPRQRGTPSPGSSQQPTTNNRVSPRRATKLSSTLPSTTTTSTHRRGGSGSGATRIRTQTTKQTSKESYDDDHNSFLSNSSKYPNERYDEEVMSIYLDSLKDPRERDSFLRFVDQQKIDAGFDPVAFPTKKNSNIISKTSSIGGVSDMESNVSDMSDTATEVIGYSNGNNTRPHSKPSNKSSSHSTQTRQNGPVNDHNDSTILSPRPGGQRAILEIASQMSPDEVNEVIELLNSMKAHGAQHIPIPSPFSNHSSTFPTSQGYQQPNPSPYSSNYPSAPTPSSTTHNGHKHTTTTSTITTTSSSSIHPPTPNQHIPSPQARRGKSGPPVLQSGNYIISEEDEEVTQHTNYNETYRLIPPVTSTSTLIHTNHSGSYSTTPSNLHGGHTSKHYRSGSATSTTSGNSNCNSPYKKSPLHDICPFVCRDSNPPRSTDLSTPTLPKPIITSEIPPVLPGYQKIIIPPPAPVASTTKNHTSTHPKTSTLKDKNLMESMQSPRSAFDDRSVSSSSSNFTSASNRSGKSKGSTSVKGQSSNNSRHH